MANTLRFKRGLASGLPTGLAGEPLFTTDTFDLYIGNGTGNTRFQKYIASGTTSQLLRGDGSLLTMPIVLSSPANGEVLKYNGTNWVNSSDAGITGSGVAGQVAYFTGATTQGGSNNLFWDATNSRLGIGTNAPTSRLYVTSPSANTTFDSGTATDARIEFRRAGTRIGYLNWDSGVVTLQADSGNYLGFNAGGSERARIDASGNLGLGTTSPTAIAGYTTLAVNNATNGGNIDLMTAGTRHASWNNTATETYFGTRSNTPLAFTTNATEVARFFANGNFRIGGNAADAGFKLDVNGTMRVSGASTFGGLMTISGSATTLLQITSTGSAAYIGMGDSSGSLTYIGSDDGTFLVQTPGSSYSTKFSINSAGAATFSSSVTAGGRLTTTFTNGVDGAYFRNTSALATNAYSQVVLSIGSDAPFQALANNRTYQIQNIATSATATDFRIQYYNGSTDTYSERFRIASDGAATFSSSVTAGARYIVSAASSAGISDISYGSLSGGAWINTPSATNGYLAVAGNAALRWSASELNFYVSAAEAMRLDANGFGIGGVPAQKLDVQGSANSIQARFGNVAGRGLTIGTRAISGTNDAGVVFNAPTATDGTLVFQTSSTDRMTLNSSGLNVATAIAIGTTPDTNLPFKILKNINSTVGIRFENTSTGASAYSAVQFGTDVTGGTAFTNMVYGSSGITESGVYKPNGTSIINTGSGGLNFLAVSQPIRFFTSTGNGTLRAAITNDGDFTQYNGTNPSASTTDAFRMYSADITAGNAAPHFRTENGAVIKLYQETTGVTSATYIGGAGTGLTDSDTFDGYTIAQIVKALRNAGLLA